MNLDIDKNVEKKDNNNWIQDFINQLSNFFKGEKNQLEEDLKIEEGLYQVIDFTENGVYLQNIKNNKTFEEINIPEEIKDQIDPDFILRYREGEYIIEQELTDEFLENMVDIQEYKKIQEEFENNTDLSEINEDTKFSIVSKEEDHTVLQYNDKQLEVPNALLPYFLDDDTILYYKNGKFEKDV